MQITIPKRLQKRLHSNSTYEGYINTLLKNTGPIITEKADFFPEYTIHGWTHIQAVLDHADKLIPDVTLRALSGWDAAMLIAAVVLHDLGMFLQRAGVRELLTGPRRTTKTDLLDQRDWTEEWDRYIREIRRYPEEKLLYHFGMSHAIEEPDLKSCEFSDLDLLIVGEFLRRHHHRIAHEIALGTMPGDADIDVLLVGLDAQGIRVFDERDRKCIGVLARSHGMPMRDTLKYIERELGKAYQEKLSYLMAVLRLADALDADERRAPDAVRKLQGIRIPVSVKEWSWNQRITRTELDWGKGKDSKYVEAKPRSTTEFVHLENWLRWVQRELDTSWAVLSEVSDTRKLQLSIHRVESNILEDGQREHYNTKFITQEARLNANPELLKLLVGPLYDDDPSCGVRELLQNAVDACNERAHLESEGYRGQVEIRLDTEAKTLTVTDNGIGMDENVLLNYYLSAGASYRTSDQWFEQFATDRDPNIVRTGRFGVGVLATFLLGHQVRVTTRHRSDELGYTFEFGLEPKALDIKRPEEQPQIGTTITVTLKEDALKKLREDYYKNKTWLNWYRFARPSVRYWINGKEYQSGKPAVAQGKHEKPGWFDLLGADYEQTCWGYPKDGFFCNGIRIPNGHKDWYPYDTYSVLAPSVSVIDKKGMLPLDLARKNLLVFSQAQTLEQEAVRYTLAQLLAADWSSEKAVFARLNGGLETLRTADSSMYSPYICGKDAYTVLHANFLNNLKGNRLLLLYSYTNTDMRQLTKMVRDMEPSIPILLHPQRLRRKPSPDDTAMMLTSNQDALLCSNRYTNRVRRVCLPKGTFREMMWKNPAVEYIYMDSGQYTETHAEYILRVYRNAGRPYIWEQWNHTISPIVAEIEFDAPQFEHFYRENEHKDPLRAFVRTYMNDDPWIPYDMEERRKKFPKAFEELKYYIDRILADREKERGARDA